MEIFIHSPVPAAVMVVLLCCGAGIAIRSYCDFSSQHKRIVPLCSLEHGKEILEVNIE